MRQVFIYVKRHARAQTDIGALKPSWSAFSRTALCLDLRINSTKMLVLEEFATGTRREIPTSLAEIGSLSLVAILFKNVIQFLIRSCRDVFFLFLCWHFWSIFLNEEVEIRFFAG